MVLRIRLARFGKKHAPFYNIVVAHARYVFASFAINEANLGSPQILQSPSIADYMPTQSAPTIIPTRC